MPTAGSTPSAALWAGLLAAGAAAGVAGEGRLVACGREQGTHGLPIYTVRIYRKIRFVSI
jgi:hypothetical protein